MADLNNERQAFAALLDSLATARDSMRAIALLRSDERWIVTAGLLDRMKDKADALMKSRPLAAGNSRIWMPGQTPGPN